MSTQTLTTGQVVSLGDGRLACPIGDLYQAFNGLLDDDLMTHQLPRAMRFVQPYIVDAYPWVSHLPRLDLDQVEDKEAAVRAWVDQISAEHGKSHEIPDLAGQWVHFDPLDEAASMFGADRVVVAPVIVSPSPAANVGDAAEKATEAFNQLGEALDSEDQR